MISVATKYGVNRLNASVYCWNQTGNMEFVRRYV